MSCTNPRAGSFSVTCHLSWNGCGAIARNTSAPYPWQNALIPRSKNSGSVARLEFTHGLAAIIGNKGSGKSALADILGLLGDSPHGDSFSFLNPEKFRQPKGNKARHFEAEICWESDGTARRNLDEVVDGASPESVKYIPQAYLETVCNELNTGTGNGFSRELKSVIFSHIGQADRLGYDNLMPC